jgi:hypothetical protein
MDYFHSLYQKLRSLFEKSAPDSLLRLAVAAAMLFVVFLVTAGSLRACSLNGGIL